MEEDSDFEDQMLNKRLAREGVQEYKPKESKSSLLQNLMNLVTDKKERVKKILSKPATERSVEELNEVANLLSNVEFLKHFKEKLLDLARFMTLETYLGKKTIVEQGSEGDKFYFVLDGKVSIFVKAFNDITGHEFLKYVVDLSPGAYFGELSLIYNAPRTATVTSCDRSDLLVISRYAYNKIIREFHIEQMDKMIAFYMNFPLFEQMSKEIVFTIVTRSKYFNISTKETVVRQGDMPKMVYFIKQGKFKVVKEVRLPRKASEVNQFQSVQRSRQTSQNVINPADSAVRQNAATDNQGHEVKYLELDELDSGDVFCHANIIDKQPMDYSVVSVLPSELYGVPANDFIMLCKDLFQDFKRYNKPYPSSQQVVQLFDQENKWNEYKAYLMKSIQVNKKLKKSPFDYTLRQPSLHAPKQVNFVPESKIKMTQMQKGVTKKKLHKHFLRTDSQESLQENKNECHSPSSKTESELPNNFIKSPSIRGASTKDAQKEDERRHKLMGISSPVLDAQQHKKTLQHNLSQLDQLSKVSPFSPWSQAIKEEKTNQGSVALNRVKPCLSQSSLPKFCQDKVTEKTAYNTLGLNQKGETRKATQSQANFPNIREIKRVVNSFKHLDSRQKKSLNGNIKNSLAYSPSLMESYNKYAPILKELRLRPEDMNQHPNQRTLSGVKIGSVLAKTQQP